MADQVEKAPVARTESAHSLDQTSQKNLKMDDAAPVAFTKASDEVTIGVGDTDEGKPQQFSGMGKDELMRLSADPFWVRLRWALFILFWLAWFGMLAGAIAIIVLAPKCPAPEPLQYWQEQPIYEVRARSFKDSDGNGVGDLKGLKEKVDYFSELGVRVVSLGSILQSAQPDSASPGLDTTNFRDIDRELGTLSDLDDLIKAAAEKKVSLVMDLVPNHSSKQHPWFADSVNGVEPYTDYYVWSNETPANSTGWHLDETRKQYYLGVFGADRPDLNLSNEVVLQELNDTLRFWLERGVAGFRVGDVTSWLHDADLTANAALLGRLRAVLDEADAAEPKRLLLADTADLTLAQLVTFYAAGADMPLAGTLVDATPAGKPVVGQELRSAMAAYVRALGSNWPNWMASSVAGGRLGSRVDGNLSEALTLAQVFLPGTPLILAGDEIGADGAVTEALDWSVVDGQRADPASRLGVFKAALDLRKTAVAARYGDTTFRSVGQNSTEVLAFSRIRSGSPGLLVLVNTAERDVAVDVSGDRVPKEAKVVLRTSFSAAPQLQSTIDATAVKLSPYQGLVLSFVPAPSDSTA